MKHPAISSFLKASFKNEEKSSIENKISLFTDLLIKWNKKINLVSRKETDHSLLSHVFDSIVLTPYFKDQTKLLDIGTGNGFPAIPISIIKKNISVVGIESNEKKTIYLKNIKNIIKIENFSIINARVESNPEELAEKFDIVTIRALKITQDLVQNILFYTKKSVSIFSYKMLDNNELYEIKNLNNAVINSVDKIVYNNPDKTKRIITRIQISKA